MTQTKWFNFLQILQVQFDKYKQIHQTKILMLFSLLMMIFCCIQPQKYVSSYSSSKFSPVSLGSLLMGSNLAAGYQSPSQNFHKIISNCSAISSFFLFLGWAFLLYTSQSFSSGLLLSTLKSSLNNSVLKFFSVIHFQLLISITFEFLCCMFLHLCPPWS